MSADDAVTTLLDKASHVLSSAAGTSTQATAHAHQVLHQFTEVRAHIDHFAHFGLLPLALVVLLLHEHYRSASEQSAFRVGYVLLRTGATVALVLGYGRVCGLITSVAGAGSGWITSNNYLDLYENGADSLGTAWNAWGGIANLPKFVGMVIVWAILMISICSRSSPAGCSA